MVPRYGADIRGGAEVGARMLAERLVADRGFEVEVLTTCALDAITWRDELPEGTSVERGVTVRRIRSQAGRNEHFHPLWAQLMEDPGCRVGGGLRQVGGLAGSAGDRSRRGGGGERRRRGGVLPVPLLPDGVRAAVGAGAGGVASSCARGARAAPARLRRAVPRVSRVCVPQPERAGAVNARFGVASTPQVLIGLGVEVPEVRWER